DSRFDWPRVMRELALILPDDVLLTSLSAGVGGESEGEGLAGVTGPSLELAGCTSSQDAVAGFVTSLKDIDGVTRVGLQSSAVGGGGESGEGGAGCSAGGLDAQFKLVVAFDAAPVPLAAEGEAAAEVEVETEGGESGEEEAEESGEG
ncbi:MAG TPA: PilN domain-containing protein, partial [Solirubrobacterales bacterium]|nr:PilN domain-containing protein [Solirubrobacterales bacterium]